MEFLQTILFLALIWISSSYSARQLNLPLAWWIIAIIILAIQAFGLKNDKSKK